MRWVQCSSGMIQNVAESVMVDRATRDVTMYVQENEMSWVQCPSGMIQNVAESAIADRATRDVTMYVQENEKRWVQCPSGMIQKVAGSVIADRSTCDVTTYVQKNEVRWVQCSSGTIQKVADSVITDRATRDAAMPSRRQILTAAATAAGVAVVGGTWYATKIDSNSSDKPMMAKNYGGIGCAEVVKALPVYIANEIQDPAKSEQIAKHLELCSTCREAHTYQVQS